MTALSATIGRPWFLEPYRGNEEGIVSSELNLQSVDSSYLAVASFVFQALAFLNPVKWVSEEFAYKIVSQMTNIDSEIRKVFNSAKETYSNLAITWLTGVNNVDVSRTIGEVANSQKISAFNYFSNRRNSVNNGKEVLIQADPATIKTGAATDINGVVPLSTIMWGEQDFAEILSGYNAVFIDTSQETVHKINIPWISDGIRLKQGNVLPDGSYKLSNGQSLKFEINESFIPVIESSLRERGIDFDAQNICFAPYVIRYDGIRYDQEMIVISEQSRLVQFEVSGFSFRSDYDIASVVNGFEIIYQSGNHYYCLGSILNGDVESNNSNLINIRLK